MNTIIESYVKNRVADANKQFATFTKLPTIIAALRKQYGEQAEPMLDAFENIVKLTVLLHPDWKEDIVMAYVAEEMGASLVNMSLEAAMS